MFRDETDMLDCRLEALAGHDVVTVAVESPYTHRGVPKGLTLPQALGRVLRKHPGARVRRVVDDWEPDPDPWVNERHQRNAAWKVIGAEAADDDVVLICDLDEIPAPALLEAAARYGREGPPWPVSVAVRTFLFAVDWEVAIPPAGMPQPAVLAPVRCLRELAGTGNYLGEVRAGWRNLARLGGEDQTWGWHFSWVGGPERQKQKLETATCHTEILSTPEADLIRSGARWRSQENGGGLPVVPVDVDETWPAYIYERRCPQSWFRPRDSKETPA